MIYTECSMVNSKYIQIKLMIVVALIQSIVQAKWEDLAEFWVDMQVLSIGFWSVRHSLAIRTCFRCQKLLLAKLARLTLPQKQDNLFGLVSLLFDHGLRVWGCLFLSLFMDQFCWWRPTRQGNAAWVWPLLLGLMRPTRNTKASELRPHSGMAEETATIRVLTAATTLQIFTTQDPSLLRNLGV